MDCFACIGRFYRRLDGAPGPVPPTPAFGPTTPIRSSLLRVIMRPPGACAEGSVLPCRLAAADRAVVPSPVVRVAPTCGVGPVAAPVMRCIRLGAAAVTDGAVGGCWLLVARACWRYAARAWPGDCGRLCSCSRAERRGAVTPATNGSLVSISSSSASRMSSSSPSSGDEEDDEEDVSIAVWCGCATGECVCVCD